MRSTEALAASLNQIRGWGAPHASAAVFDVAGVAAAWGDLSHPFALASVTKLLVAFAVLVATEEGTLALDQPAGPPGSTVAHLLSHSSGLGPDGGVLAPVGSRRIYSNAGFEVIGTTLANASGMSLVDYVHAAVLEPLAMTASRIDGSPASGATSTVADLARFGAELMTPRLVAPTTLAAATQPVLPELAGVLPGFGPQRPNPWGLGFEIRGRKDPHWTGSRNSERTFGHFGQSGTFLWVDPDVHLGAIVLTDRAFGPWAATQWPKLADDLLLALP